MFCKLHRYLYVLKYKGVLYMQLKYDDFVSFINKANQIGETQQIIFGIVRNTKNNTVCLVADIHGAFSAVHLQIIEEVSCINIDTCFNGFWFTCSQYQLNQLNAFKSAQNSIVDVVETESKINISIDENFCSFRKYFLNATDGVTIECQDRQMYCNITKDQFDDIQDCVKKMSVREFCNRTVFKDIVYLAQEYWYAMFQGVVCVRKTVKNVIADSIGIPMCAIHTLSSFISANVKEIQMAVCKDKLTFIANKVFVSVYNQKGKTTGAKFESFLRKLNDDDPVLFRIKEMYNAKDTTMLYSCAKKTLLSAIRSKLPARIRLSGCELETVEFKEDLLFVSTNRYSGIVGLDTTPCALKIHLPYGKFNLRVFYYAVSFLNKPVFHVYPVVCGYRATPWLMSDGVIDVAVMPRL